MSVAFAIAYAMLVLHGPDGREVYINPVEITVLHEQRPSDYQNKAMKAVHCRVNLSDGNFVLVTESCPDIRELISRKEP